MRSLPNARVTLKRILLPMVGIFFVSFSLMAQASLTCTDRNTIIDGILCTNTFTPADLGGDDAIHTLTLETLSGDVIANNQIFPVHIGQTLIYSITLTSTGAQLCWAYLNVEDKSDPIIICPGPVEITCSQSREILSTPTAENPLENATATDCYGDLTVTWFDQVRNLDCDEDSDFSQIITRTFVAVGTNGRTASCTQEISVERADTSDVTMPIDYSESCLTSVSTDPLVTGYPTYDPDGNGAIPPINLIPGQTGGACMLISDYFDLDITKCGPEQLIKRTWL